MFYHSFPRSKPGQDSIQKGLKILENFLANGILLVPEVIDYPREKDEKKETPEEYYLAQRRFCMTEINISELADHAKYFGDFHIEFKPENAYALGAIPVFYLPKYETDTVEWSLKKIASTCIYGLTDLENLCKNIQSVAQILEEKPNQETVLVGKGENENDIQYKFNAEILRGALDMLTDDIIPYSDKDKKTHKNITTHMSNLCGIIKGISSLIYPTDRITGGEPNDLYNFRQREWRIIGGLRIGDRELDRELKPEEKDFLFSYDPGFFGEKKLIYADSNGEKQSRIECCTIMPKIIYQTKPKPWQKDTKKEIKEKPVQELVERIIVPKAALEEARKIAKKNKFDPSLIVDFETAMELAISKLEADFKVAKELAAIELEYEAVKNQQRIQLLCSAKTMAEQKGVLLP